MIAIIPGFPAFEYQEKIPGSPVYTFTNGSSRVERTFTCPWVVRIGLVQYLLGYPTILNAGGTSFVSRYLPDAMLDCLVPGKDETWLYATSVVRLVGSGETGLYDDNGIAIYKTAVVTVSYESRTYRMANDDELLTDIPIPDPDNPENTILMGFPDESTQLRNVTRFQKPSAEFIQLPRGLMKWVDGIKNANGQPQPVDYATARLITSTEFALTWHEVPFIPDAATAFVGCLNKTTFTVASTDPNTPDKPFSAGTLLLLASEIKPYRTGAGVFVQDITYRIKYMEPQPGRGHNFFMRHDKVANDLIYEKLTADGNNDYVAIDPDAVTLSPYNPAIPPAGKPDRRVPLAAGTSRAVYAYAGFTSLFRLNIALADQVVGQ